MCIYVQLRQALADELAALCERIDKEFTATRTDTAAFSCLRNLHRRACFMRFCKAS